MAEVEVDEFGVRKIYLSNRDPIRAKPWLLGRDDWKSRKYDWDGDITSHVENGFLILKIKRYVYVLDQNGNFVRDENGNLVLNKRLAGRGRKPVLAIPLQYDLEGQLKPIVTLKHQTKLRKRVYMGTSADWKNVEITLYIRVNDVDFDQTLPRMAFAARGGPRHSNVWLFGDPCQGCAYYTALKVDGSVALQKEFFHDDGGYSAEKEGITYIPEPIVEDLLDQRDHRVPRRTRWIGMKGIFYNNENGNPKIELWLDRKSNNDWGSKAVLEIEDTLDRDAISDDVQPEATGGWFVKRRKRPSHIPSNLPWPERNKCGGEANERLIWGGPAVIFRWDGLLDVDIKWASVREIVPPVMSLRNLLKAKEISFPADIRSVAEDYGLMATITIRDLAERLL